MKRQKPIFYRIGILVWLFLGCSFAAFGELDIKNVTNATFGNEDGSIEVIATGSAAPFEVTITGGNLPNDPPTIIDLMEDGTGLQEGLAAGAYHIIMEDRFGCEWEFDVTVGEECIPLDVVIHQADCNTGSFNVVINNSPTVEYTINITGEHTSYSGIETAMVSIIPSKV